MAITCPKCGAEYDVTLFEFERGIICDCGQWVDLAAGHRQSEEGSKQASKPANMSSPTDQKQKDEVKLPLMEPARNVKIIKKPCTSECHEPRT